MHVSIADLWKANRIHALALCQCTFDWCHSRPRSRGSRCGDQHMGLWCLCQTQWWSNRSAPQLEPPACPAAGFCVDACLEQGEGAIPNAEKHVCEIFQLSSFIDYMKLWIKPFASSGQAADTCTVCNCAMLVAGMLSTLRQTPRRKYAYMQQLCKISTSNNF